MSVSKAVEAHYNKPQLEQLILEALSRAGHDGQHLKPMDLAPVDEFHLGALESTQAMAPFMELWPGMHLLDVGCGIGGPARYFAENITTIGPNLDKATLDRFEAAFKALNSVL